MSNIFHNKIVIQVWTQSTCNLKIIGTENYWGLGDIIRGTIQLYQLSKKMGFSFHVNTILHPIHQFLKYHDNEYDNLISANINNIKFIGIESIKKELENATSNIIFFFTNGALSNETINNDDKLFIKHLLEPIDSIKQSINTIINKMQVTDYTILHYRMGDTEFTDNNIKNYERAIYSIVKNNSNNTILMSDSQMLKQYAKKEKILTLDLEIGHIGLEKDANKIRNTLIEFYIITNSKTIKTYSVYKWTSGFVYWTSKIYDIPLIKINKLKQK